MVVFLFTLHAHAQKTTSTPSHLKQHVLQVFALEDWALSCKWMLSAPYHDSVKTWEVLNTDSTVSFVSLLYPTEASYSKGSVYAGNYMILGDTLHPGALADTLGSFKRFYPMDSILDAKASIAFFFGASALWGSFDVPARCACECRKFCNRRYALPQRRSKQYRCSSGIGNCRFK